MVAIRSILGVAALVSTVAASAGELQLIARLLKRQEPGTPAYYCHDNCGQAIIQARTTTPNHCTDNIFLTDYKNCLQCAGPDNVNIWTFYGGTLGAAAARCSGLATSPLSGKQPDVGPAIPAGSSGGGSSSTSAPPPPASSTPPPPQSTPSSTPPPPASSTPAPTAGGSSSAQPSQPASSGSSSVARPSSAGSSAAPSGYATTTARPSSTAASGTTGVARPSSSSSVVPSSANKALAANAAIVYGAIVFGAVYALF